MAFFNSSTTLVGNTVRDGEVRFTPSGRSVTDTAIAVNYRKKVGDDYEDDPSYVDLVIWGELGEHFADSCPKGTRVLVTGRLTQQRWETPDGDKRSKIVLVVEAIGPDLTWATANVTRTTGGGRGPSAGELAAQQEGGSQPRQQQRQQTQAPANNGDPGPQYDYDGMDEPF